MLSKHLHVNNPMKYKLPIDRHYRLLKQRRISRILGIGVYAMTCTAIGLALLTSHTPESNPVGTLLVKTEATARASMMVATSRH